MDEEEEAAGSIPEKKKKKVKRGNNVLKVCWDLDVHFSHFSGQTAMRNQVKNPELPDLKKGIY